MRFGYGHDAAGNTVEAGFLRDSGEPAHRFTANDMNVHVRRVWSNAIEVAGTCATLGTNVTITVNDRLCHRDWPRGWPRGQASKE